MLASNRRQQAGHAVELSPVGIGLPHFSAAQVRVFGGLFALIVVAPGCCEDSIG
jgi:hypothetical protein